VTWAAEKIPVGLTCGKGRRGSGKTPGPAVHDDHMQRDFTADEPNRKWVTDITEHATTEGTLLPRDQRPVQQPDHPLREEPKALRCDTGRAIVFAIPETHYGSGIGRTP
jgi:transposase InsO family protein